MLLPCAITERNVQNAFAEIHWCTDGTGKKIRMEMDDWTGRDDQMRGDD